MPTTLNPYLSFRDNARDAIEFYRSVFGGELTISTYEEFQMAQDPSENGKIMHSQLTTPNGMTLMAADTPKSMEYSSGSSVAVSLSGSDEAELRRYWEKLSDRGTVTAPFEKAPWGDYFGQCVDRFGVNWLVNAAGA